MNTPLSVFPDRHAFLIGARESTDTDIRAFMNTGNNRDGSLLIYGLRVKSQQWPEVAASLQKYKEAYTLLTKMRLLPTGRNNPARGSQSVVYACRAFGQLSLTGAQYQGRV